ncbi:hypothetical protein DL766_006229 [Monosporascus sp. MC13-8B]|uniref:FAD-binding domain-containing protein n=1 Tax=Monosporascus cannonballus TaxID=155416 RepID=A0ABY0HF16_9PEZI|nr:hypothetical protein DL763_010339 [Monosporascus cannonballus]RYO89016.1 hypothetical protein DL762_003446 [Monosporascus cannonballus]RYP27785.1 hypothetical protein DL766_006229 [Monosporascus sp. MC13-8B]
MGHGITQKSEKKYANMSLNRYGAPLLTLHRAHLRQLLYDEAIAQGVTVRHGVGVGPAGIDLANGTLHLSSPDETFHANLFVGADGGHSVVREALTRRKPRAIPHGKVQPNIVVWLGPESQAVTYGLDGTYNVAVTWLWSSDPEDVFFGPQPVDLADFRAQLGAWDPDLRELVSLGTGCALWMFFEPEIDGDGTLWVDATGPLIVSSVTAGQGAAAGIESVSVLAHLLGKAVAEDDDDDDDRWERVGDALDIYQRLRKDRTTHVIRATLKTGRLWQMPDGLLKDKRDRELLRETGNHSVGYPNPLADPFFQRWLWGFDAPEAAEAADRAWAAYQRGNEAGRA